ncbi:Avirulence (Avh) protein [Phytophthora megakarya]|uniref:RxLR effector protein n=1 Tax=Phytophthora megakarya TaxID=4795 RepID=A0A225W272_9STRA|nr:Avirulence (Avh) protein [Phytophthora megakarya]
MRLSQILFVTAASFLFASEAFSPSTDLTPPDVSNLDTPSDTNQRVLRVHHKPEDTWEERNFDKFSKTHQKHLIRFAKNLGFDLKKSLTDTSYFAGISPDTIHKYHDEYLKIRQAYA